ncbi:MAG: hypothetical protein IMZ69_00650 [Spirochaetes bacterium]|nr:hypothetical protein [Spirochaetota bacterium]
MSKAEILVSIVLALVGFGLMAGQNFAINGLVLMFWGSACAVALYGLITHRQKEKPGPTTEVGKARDEQPLTLAIHSAQYGLGEGQYRDVTAIVQALVVDGRLHVPVENMNLAPDNPFKGKRKHLLLVYSLGGTARHTITAGEHLWVDLPTGREPH